MILTAHGDSSGGDKDNRDDCRCVLVVMDIVMVTAVHCCESGGYEGNRNDSGGMILMVMMVMMVCNGVMVWKLWCGRGHLKCCCGDDCGGGHGGNSDCR